MLVTASALVPASAEPVDVNPFSAAGDVVTSGNLDVQSSAGDFVALGSESSVEIPATSTGPMVVSDNAGDTPDVTITPAGLADSGEGSRGDHGGVDFDNASGGMTTALPKDDGSLQIVTTIDSADSPHDYAYKIGTNGSRDLTLVKEGDGGVSILDDEGNWVGGIAKPWAVDANGTELPTSYSVEGTSVVQHVDFDASTAFPVVADPWLGKTLIKRTAWANVSKYSPTLKVYPTTWGRWTGAGARWSAWKEVLSKTTGSGAKNPNTPTMKNQFYCHFDFVRIRYPNKTSWNLDTKIPNRGYTGFIKSRCN